jgi:hypothetical protein
MPVFVVGDAETVDRGTRAGEYSKWRSEVGGTAVVVDLASNSSYIWSLLLLRSLLLA